MRLTLCCFQHICLNVYSFLLISTLQFSYFGAKIFYSVLQGSRRHWAFCPQCLMDIAALHTKPRVKETNEIKSRCQCVWFPDNLGSSFHSVFLENQRKSHTVNGNSIYTSNKVFAYSVQSIKHRDDRFKRNSEKGKKNARERHWFFKALLCNSLARPSPCHVSFHSHSSPSRAL